jgi:hypothetical protein
VWDARRTSRTHRRPVGKGQVFLAWDDGSTLAMLPGDGDEIRLITPPGDQPQ